MNTTRKCGQCGKDTTALFCCVECYMAHCKAHVGMQYYTDGKVSLFETKKRGKKE